MIADHDLKLQAAGLEIWGFYGEDKFAKIPDALWPSIRDSGETLLQQSYCYRRFKPELLAFGLTEDEVKNIAFKNCPDLVPFSCSSQVAVNSLHRSC